LLDENFLSKEEIKEADELVEGDKVINTQSYPNKISLRPISQKHERVE